MREGAAERDALQGKIAISSHVICVVTTGVERGTPERVPATRESRMVWASLIRLWGLQSS